MLCLCETRYAYTLQIESMVLGMIVDTEQKIILLAYKKPADA